MHYSAAILIAVFFVGAADASGAATKPPFVMTPKLTDEIMRGVEDGLHCALAYMGPTQISNCAFAMARQNARDGSDARAYNLGLTFETWRDLDVDYAADQKPAKPGDISPSQRHDEEAGTRAMYLLYRSARDALGVSEPQLMTAMTKMSPAWKAESLARLQFWGKKVH